MWIWEKSTNVCRYSKQSNLQFHGDRFICRYIRIAFINGSVSKIKFEAIKYHMSIEINWAFYSIRMNRHDGAKQKPNLFWILVSLIEFACIAILPSPVSRSSFAMESWPICANQCIVALSDAAYTFLCAFFFCFIFYLFGFYRSAVFESVGRNFIVFM